MLLCLAVELLPQFRGRAHNGQGEECSIDHGLAAVVEIHKVRRCGICTRLDGHTRPLGILIPQAAFRTALWAGFEPRRDTGEQPAHGLQIGKLAPIRHVTVGRFHRHLRLELSLTESLQNGVRDPGQDLNPVFTIVRLHHRWTTRPNSQGWPREPRARYCSSETPGGQHP